MYYAEITSPTVAFAELTATAEACTSTCLRYLADPERDILTCGGRPLSGRFRW